MPRDGHGRFVIAHERTPLYGLIQIRESISFASSADAPVVKPWTKPAVRMITMIRIRNILTSAEVGHRRNDSYCRARRDTTNQRHPFVSARQLTMSRREKNCWEQLGWVRGEQIRDKEGNQSHTFLARRCDDPPDEFAFVLKSLKRQDLPDRRAMFHIETSAMRALNHPGILTIEQTNSERYKDPVELFLITRKAPGLDLDDRVSVGLHFDDALRIVIGVLDIVNHCHSRGVVHRDIKPCHVLTPDDKLVAPTLIDFGLAHSQDLDLSDAATKTGHGKGNRFLIGPEHMPGTSLMNRSAATDICQCLGLLFFALTGRYPGILRNENDQKPHRRPDSTISHEIPEWKRDAIALIFDRGFEWHPDKRWNDASLLAERLRLLLKGHIGPDELLKLRAARTIQDSQIESMVNTLRMAQNMSQQFVEMTKKVVFAINDQSKEFVQVDLVDSRQVGFGGGFSAQQNGDILFSTVLSFRLQHRPQGMPVIAIQTALEGTRFVASLCPYTGKFQIFPNSTPIELGRLEVTEAPDFSDIRSDLENKLLACLQEVLSGGQGTY
jgi:serine/threonine protein kinase